MKRRIEVRPTRGVRFRALGAPKRKILVERRTSVDNRVAAVEVERVERDEEQVAFDRFDRVVAAARKGVEEVLRDERVPD